MIVVTVARRPLAGSVAANVLQHGTGAIDVARSRVPPPDGRWPANLVLEHGRTCWKLATGLGECDEECPVPDLDQQGGHSVTGVRSDRSRAASVSGTTWGVDNHLSREYPDEAGGASRFFKQVQG